MTGNELRSKYLSFFQSKDSLIIPSSSLIPSDPTTLLTSAGMQPLVPFFKGEETPPATRLASCQKCCRTDDFEQVGVTWRHASFFEMLGNFSFGDYFKREAIVWGWEFLTKELNIDPDVLWVSVYHEDTEAPEFWKKDVGLSDERIYRFGKKDNWWGPVGASGPCGPDSEIFFDRGARYDTGDPEMDRPGGDGDRYGELWNLVFQQYNQREDKTLEPLPAPGIDTGMGLERTAAVLQGVDTIHHCDLFAPIIHAIQNLKSGELPYSAAVPDLNPDNPLTRPTKVIADHVRAAAFMVGDGIVPGNNGRDYMLRRLIRRAYLSGRSLNQNEPFLFRLVPTIVRTYGEVYPELAQREDIISDRIRREEEQFNKTISSGMSRLQNLIGDVKARGEQVLAGAEAFDLYSSEGFPPELTSELLAEEGLSFDEAGYREAEERHRKVSGTAVGAYEKREFVGLETEFVGYETLGCTARVLAVREDEKEGEQGSSKYLVVLDRTPFYAESGGQIGDTGTLTGEGFQARVTDTKKQGKTWIHTVQVETGELGEGADVQALVDGERRAAIQRAHSATHLLHAALRKHLGTHVEQRGSLVEPDRLRFDFVHFAAIPSEQILEIEDAVNEEILRSLPVETSVTTLDEARARGAMALFGEKYGDHVRLVQMGDFSLELCGGTHLPTTSAAGLLRLTAESGVGSNLRRVEALTGRAALMHDRQTEDRLKRTSQVLGTTPDAVSTVASRMQSRVRELEKQVAESQRQMAVGSADELAMQAKPINGVQVLAARAPLGLDANALRDLADRLSDKLDGVAVLAGESNGKVLWAVKASKSAVEKGAHAGNLVRELAKATGGGGGGRPDFAQAGGKDASKVDEALESVAVMLGGMLGT
jgi:alanyl-tRNA synthetase